MSDFDIVGGKADGTKFWTTVRTPHFQIELRGEKYQAIEFQAKPLDKSRAGRVIIYHYIEMKAIDAIKLWRQRFMSETEGEPVKL
jgi:hypothetical protein